MEEMTCSRCPQDQARGQAHQLAERVLTVVAVESFGQANEKGKHLDIAGGRVVVEVAVTELPGGPVIDTPKDHQRRELLVPGFVVAAVRE